MYGWVHKCLKETIVNLCGEEKWREICAKSGVEDREGMLEKTSYNDDSEYFAIIKATLELLPHVSEEDLYNLYGDYFMSYIRKNGYEHYLRTFGDSLFEVINNVNKMHGDLATSMSKMKMPDIHCEECEGEDCFLLYYSSPRGSQLKGMLLGIVRALGRSYFRVHLTTTAMKLEENSPYHVWKIHERKIGMNRRMSSEGKSLPKKKRAKASLGDSFSISADQFHLLSPCHVIFNDKFEILQASDNMVHGELDTSRHDIRGKHMWNEFKPIVAGVKDLSSMSWESFRVAVYALTKHHAVVFNEINCMSNSGNSFSYVGKVVFLRNSKGYDHAAVFLGSPNVNSLNDMHDQEVVVQDLEKSDACRLRMLQNEAHLRHFKDTSTEAETKLTFEKQEASRVKKDLNAKKRLLMYVSNEIRTPLSIAKLGCQLISNHLDKIADICAFEIEYQQQNLIRDENCTNISKLNSKGDTKLPMISPRSVHQNKQSSDRILRSPRKTKVEAESNPSNALKIDVKRIVAELRSLTADSEHTIQFATSIFDDLLSYEKLQSGSLDVAKVFVPCAMVEGVANEFGVEANYFNIDLKFETDMSIRDQRDIMVHVDVPKLCQVIRNYVSNALKFTPKGGKVTVSMSFNRDEVRKDEPPVVVEGDMKSYAKCGTLHVGVRDTGIGIAEVNHPRVFHEMGQFGDSHPEGGTGLGLYISRAIVDKLSGNVGFESKGLGHGCYFYFSIPAYCLSSDVNDPRSPVSARRLSITPKTNVVSALKGRTVLICDDSTLCRKMLRKVLLNKECNQIFEAKNGLEAVQMIESRQDVSSACSNSSVLPPFDCIFMDNNMPVLRGTEATRQIRQLGFTNLIIGVTGNVTDEDVEGFIASGVDGVFHKPLDFRNLENFLLRHLSPT